MKPWREVLAERGWRPDSTCDWATAWIHGFGAQSWSVLAEDVPDGVRMSVWRDGGGECFEESECTYPTEDAAFAALMAKPIGPGRVTVGVLLGVV